MHASHTPATTTATSPGTEADAPDAVDASSSRRTMLRTLALGAAAAGATSVVARAGSAAADNGQNVILGQVNTHTTTTTINYSGAVTASSFNIQSGDETAANDGIINTVLTNQGTALLAVASGNGNQGVGLTGWSKKANGTGVVGFTGAAGAYGGEFFGGLAEVRLRPGGNAPITLTTAHQVGELYEDAVGTLWICVVAGTPGSWREIAGANTAGAFHPITPRRAYDSRNDSKMQPTVDRVISVKDSTDGTLDIVPVSATAVTLTVTVTETEGAGGFLAVRPDATTYNNTSSVNWFGPSQNLAATVISGLGGDRKIILRAGANPTHVVVDVTGYYR